jgi:mandelamide amidase
MKGGRMRWINAIAHLDETGAMEAAKKCDQARQGKAAALCEHSSLPLFGVPIVVKDNIHIANMPSTAGTPALQNFVPTDTNSVVERLVRAGAIVVGKATMHELAMGVRY